MEESIDSLKSTKYASCRLIVTKVPIDVFTDIEAKSIFEQVFRTYDGTCEFIYLPSFHRVIVTMSTPEAAVMARFETQGWRLQTATVGTSNANEHESSVESEDVGIRCYFADDNEECRKRQRRQARPTVKSASFDDDRLTDEDGDDGGTDEVLDDMDTFEHLALPKPEHLFLLSPPASPPVGWEPKVEAEPLINYDLLHALAALEPGKAHELHPPERDKPGIVVTPCEGALDVKKKKKRDLPDSKIPHTACPNRN
ncbi:Calcipressin-2 [Taenia solium]|eukprot:TsM_001138700 transcript=TsM_001138700 gene=TsM_001138700